MFYKKSKGAYVDSKGKRVSKRISDKIRKVYIPPGYKDVKYLLHKDLLATGVDSKGRTQYIYSNEHKKARTQKRAKTVLKVSKVISKLEKTIDKLIAVDERALVMKLIMTCHFRIGCESNAKTYKHYGVTTIRPKHVRFRSSNKCIVSFVGKKGVHNKGVVRCPKTIRALKRLVRSASKNDGGRIFSVRNHESNSILKPFHVTSKDLRTWYANVEFVKSALKQKNVRDALASTAELFHNTPAVLKSSYIVPKVYEHFKDAKTTSSTTKNPVKLLLKLI